jgi:hypothetical protein
VGLIDFGQKDVLKAPRANAKGDAVRWMVHISFDWNRPKRKAVTVPHDIHTLVV